jgi:hypothetical protein
VIAQTAAYDHCNFTVLDGAPPQLVERFTELLLGMRYDDAAVRPLLDLEGLKQWRPGRTSGYALLDRACERFGFFNPSCGRWASGERAMTATLDLGDLGLDQVRRCCCGSRSPPLARRRAARVRPRPGPRRAPARVGARRGPRGRAGAAATRAPFVAELKRGTARPPPAGREPNEPAPLAWTAWSRTRRRIGVWPRAAPRSRREGRGSTSRSPTGRGLGRRRRRAVRAAAAAQWDPATAIPWHAERSHPPFVEDALVQVLTYLIENETVALLVPARFCAQVHPHFREVMQLLAIQAADEARHIEVFTRRALLARSELGLSTAGGQASLQTLLDEPDFALASFLLSVLGEGSFVHLLGFLHRHAPDACTAEIMRLAAQDEARHVQFGMSHLLRHAAREPTLLARLRVAIERRHDALRHTAGLNAEVADALVVLAAGELSPVGIARGAAAVAELQAQMDAGRRTRLRKLGFAAPDAEALSGLHTRNFM